VRKDAARLPAVFVFPPVFFLSRRSFCRYISVFCCVNEFHPPVQLLYSLIFPMKGIAMAL
jgi:hypothetical protein